VPGDFAPAPYIGLAAFAALILVLYGWMMRKAATNQTGP